MSDKKIKKMVGLAIFTAIVVVLQLLGSFIKVGSFSISLVLIPIVVGAAVYGPRRWRILRRRIRRCGFHCLRQWL